LREFGLDKATELRTDFARLRPVAGEDSIKLGKVRA
jgi:hypothetical protein